jgi:menaquinone-9 beta-reductase
MSDPTRTTTSALPRHCEVLVVGSGPAGSACAITLARAGKDVVLIDQHDFPRDKICGDGLIPDAHAALSRLGVLEQVLSQAHSVSGLRFVGPKGLEVDLSGTLSVLPRKILDNLLVDAAKGAGARFFAPVRFEGPLEHSGRVIGAKLKAAKSDHCEIHADWVVLATGASPQALMASGVCDQVEPSGIALRAYISYPGFSKIYPENSKQLQVAWNSKMRHGYGWIFPIGDDLFNIGTGLTGGQRTLWNRKNLWRSVNLRQMLSAFSEVYPPANELLTKGEMVGPIKGAPFRCSLSGSRLSKPGLLVTGEAAGSTYAFTGEGIGKAMETGILAGESLLGFDDDVTNSYELSIHRLRPRFKLYHRAGLINSYPSLMALFIQRARNSQYIRDQAAMVLEERRNPGELMSLAGFWKLMTR